MAERRMFSKAVISSARFLRMPSSSRLLYYDLGMEADDDGCVEAFSVIRKTGATEDDLKVLSSKGFVQVLNDDLVTLIIDWHANNQIRRDRYRPSVYRDIIDALYPPALPENAGETKVENGDCQSVGDGVPTDGKPMVNQMETQYRLGKYRLGKDRLGKDRLDKDRLLDGDRPADAPEKTTPPPDKKPKPKPKPQEKIRHKHGAYDNVLLSDEEMEKLMHEFPDDYRERIERLSEYMASTGKSYKSHLATIRAWARNDPVRHQRGNVFAQLAAGEEF